MFVRVWLTNEKRTLFLKTRSERKVNRKLTLAIKEMQNNNKIRILSIICGGMHEDSSMNLNEPIAHIADEGRYNFLCEHLRRLLTLPRNLSLNSIQGMGGKYPSIT